MQLALIAHIAAGSLAILAGAGALASRKGGRLHLAAGQTFAASMLLMAALGGGLALLAPSSARGAAPPQASTTVAAMTLYLVTTAWLTVRRRARAVGWPERAASAASLAITAALLLFGARAAAADPRPAAYVPYFVFALLAGIAAALDLRLLAKGGVAGADRIARHLWRMCLALFFACAFFFIGQQKVMPVWMRGSPLLAVAALAPLLVMGVWLARIWATRAAVGGRRSSVLQRVLGVIAFRPGPRACSS